MLDIGKHKHIESINIKQKINHLEKYIQIVKEYLLEEIPMEITGRVFRLDSRNTSSGGVILVETYIADEKEIIQVRLDGEKYLMAVAAHSHEQEVKVKGNAKQRATNYYIEKADVFMIS